jgi:hypothetical protein
VIVSYPYYPVLLLAMYAEPTTARLRLSSVMSIEFTVNWFVSFLCPIYSFINWPTLEPNLLIPYLGVDKAKLSETDMSIRGLFFHKVSLRLACRCHTVPADTPHAAEEWICYPLYTRKLSLRQQQFALLDWTGHEHVCGTQFNFKFIAMG